MKHSAQGSQDLRYAVWRKSKFSADQGNCIEVADGFRDIMPVRDSKNPQDPALVFTADAWSAFVACVRAGALPLA
ncbi:DUF397 domain-containing protein [Kitasatospora sp. NBC_01250]|uniref:DUF397 domain-containing protein n=1 Tax=unclassified Kitasatospora TaxID=2633591 RepID=UPI002E1654C0|nr:MULTISPECIES: DUF397 domain-containing protein [unclassified Kitasatospora]WSJ70180.1 DUF397 domain-containing protein [Kitasatospora sp. NBC_01302]